MTSPMTSEELEHLWDEVSEERPSSNSAHVNGGPAPANPDPDVDEFLAGEDPDYDWIVPLLLERGDRVVLTGGEGHGKSTLSRQFGTKAAAGIHPFDDSEIEPVRVLLVDLENSRRTVRRKLRPLRLAAGGRLQPERLRVIVRPEGIDLLEGIDRRWLADRVTASRPELLVIGPLYKMSGGDPTEERTARVVARCLDDLREGHGVAMLIEAHQRHAAPREPRPERPYGASLWVRWPEFGLCLAPDGRLLHWRGPRDERAWPAKLTRGGAWPWTVTEEPEVEPVGSTRRERILAAVGDAPWTRTRTALLDAAGCQNGPGRKDFDLLVTEGRIAPRQGVTYRSDGQKQPVDLWGPADLPEQLPEQLPEVSDHQPVIVPVTSGYVDEEPW